MQVTDIRFHRVRASWAYEGPLGEERAPSPLDVYEEYRTRHGRTWPVSTLEEGPPYPITALFLYIDTDEGISGIYGPVSEDEARIIHHRLARVVIGEDPHAVERIWDKMYRANIAGNQGAVMTAISKVDLALWDLKGRIWDAPVYELLGGPSRSQIQAYASMLGFSVEPELVQERSEAVAEDGYTGIKWFFRHGPGAGQEGVEQNLALVEAAREGAGPDVGLMFDCWKSWDVPYTQRMAKLAAGYRPRWFEEPVPPVMIPQYAELRRTIDTVAISGGEHAYTRWGMKALLDAKAVDILQPDPTWAGGLTEMTKICGLASAYGIPVIPHHGGLAASHLIASQTTTTCPLQEWLFQAGRRDNVFLQQKIEPEEGYFALPEGPGLGIALDEDAVEEIEEVTF